MSAEKIEKMPQSVTRPYIDELLKGVVETLRVQCKVDVIPLPEIPLAEFEHPKVEIASVIPLLDGNVTGVIALCLTESLFLHLMSCMLGEELSEIDEEIEDGAGELLNIIFGCAKKVLNDIGYKIEKAIPTVVTGPSIKVVHLTPGETTVLPFKIGDSSFHVQIGFEDLG